MAIPATQLLPLLSLLAVVLLPTQTLGAIDGEDDYKQPPEVAREFRAAWIATVANIDWPSKRDLTVEQMKSELAALLDLSVDMKLNAVVFQVRPACDAMYKSKLEPWSPFLTGEMGKAPEGGFDPLEWACEQAHRRGLELHAWFNPYRAVHPSYGGKLDNGHIAVRRPELAPKYGSYNWLEPTNEEAAQHSLDVVLDVVKRYDIDAVHFDDYFYPYPVNEKNAEGKSVEVPFPDQASWDAYCEATPEADRMTREDWRRDAVNRFIQELGDAIHATKPHVRYGISPFGIWRPGYPEGIQGFDQYDKLYADARLWLQEGWVDYMAPQLYWAIDQKPQSFTTLLSWWADKEQNPFGRHVWPGLYTGRVSGENPKYQPDEIVNQIVTAREQRGAQGHIHFSIKVLKNGTAGLTDLLKQGVYSEPALVPATPWLAGDEPLPAAPIVERKEGDAFKLISEDGAQFLWVLQKRCGKSWTTAIIPGDIDQITVSADETGAAADALVVTAVDRLGRESEPTVIELSDATEE